MIEIKNNSLEEWLLQAVSKTVSLHQLTEKTCPLCGRGFTKGQYAIELSLNTLWPGCEWLHVECYEENRQWMIN